MTDKRRGKEREERRKRRRREGYPVGAMGNEVEGSAAGRSN